MLSCFSPTKSSKTNLPHRTWHFISRDSEQGWDKAEAAAAAEVIQQLLLCDTFPKQSSSLNNHLRTEHSSCSPLWPGTITHQSIFYFPFQAGNAELSSNKRDLNTHIVPFCPLPVCGQGFPFLPSTSATLPSLSLG